MKEGCKYLCMVGGFSASKYLQMRMFKAFGKKSKYSLMIYTPARPMLSVVDGAARMGLKPDFISARTIAKTYGIAVQQDLKEFAGLYPDAQIPRSKISKRAVENVVHVNENKKQSENILNFRTVVNDVFFAFIRSNSMIVTSAKPIVHYFEPASCDSTMISVRLFDSTEHDPMFVGTAEIAKINVELPLDFHQRKERKIPVIFLFGDTTLRVFIGLDGIPEEQREIIVDFDIQ